MDSYYASKFDLAETLRPDDRDAELYDWERQHLSTCEMDRMMLMETVRKEGEKHAPHLVIRPCCSECHRVFWRHEGALLVAHGPEPVNVIDLHPEQAA